MSKDREQNELENILKKVREETAAKSGENSAPPADLEPPKPSLSQREAANGSASAREEAPQENESEKKSPQEDKAPAEKRAFLRPKFAIIKANFKTRLLPRVTAFFKKAVVVRTLIALVVIAALVGIGFGGVKLYEYSKVAYLKPYIQKYGIEYPAGIREEFCDDYGRDRTFAGRLVIDGASVDEAVSQNADSSDAVMDGGGTVLQDQHLRSVSLQNNTLEKIYATAKGYENADQRVVFKTLFGDEEYKVIAAYYANTDPAKDNGYVFPYNAWGNLTERSYKSYIDRVGTRSLYLTQNRTEYNDYFLSLNMPAANQEDARFVLLCRRVAEGETFEKTDVTKPNKRIHQTQAWYDENGEQNPYRLAADWYPEIYTDAGRTKTKQLTAEDFEK